MSEITNIKQSILSDITGKEYINRRNYLEPPVMSWVNEQTQLNATNLNKMSRSIKAVQEEFSTECNNVQTILADVVHNIAGWSSIENNTAEIFNDYENNKAIADYSSAKGTYTIAGKVYQHSDGHTETSGKASSVEGLGTVSTSDHQHVQGRWNILDEQTDGAKLIAGNKYAHIIGNGTSEDNRSNAHTVSWEGDGWFARHLTADGNATFGTNGNNRHKFKGKTLFENAVKINSNLGIYGDAKLNETLTVNGAAQLNSTLSVIELTTLTNANISGKTTSKDLEVSDSTILNGSITINGESEFKNKVTFSGLGEDNEVYIKSPLVVDGQATFVNASATNLQVENLEVTVSTTLTETQVNGDLDVTGTLTCNTDVKVVKDNTSISLEDEHDHLDYTNLTVGDKEEKTVPNAIKYSEDKLIGKSTLTTDFPTEMAEVKLENETIYGAAQYSINLVKSLLNAYILDNDNDDDEARTAIDKLIEIADWISTDEAGVTKILSDIESLKSGKLDSSSFNDFVTNKFNVTERIVHDGAQGWDEANNLKHTHNNKSTIDSISPQKVSEWDEAYNSRYTGTNIDLLKEITPERVADWDAAILAEGVTAEAIAGVIKDGEQITTNTQAIETINQNIKTINGDIESIESKVDSNSDSIDALVSRITDLESNINTLIKSGTYDPGSGLNDPGSTYFIKYEE